MKKVIKLLGLVLLLQFNLGAIAQTDIKNVAAGLCKLKDPKLQLALKAKLFFSLPYAERMEFIGFRKYSDLFAKLFSDLATNIAKALELEHEQTKALASELNISIAQSGVNKKNTPKCLALSKKLIKAFGPQISKSVSKIINLLNTKQKKTATMHDINDILVKTLSSCSDTELTTLSNLANTKTIASIVNNMDKLIDFAIEKTKN